MLKEENLMNLSLDPLRYIYDFISGFDVIYSSSMLFAQLNMFLYHYFIFQSYLFLQFYAYIYPKLEIVNMKTDFLNRNVNEGFSGGEKKRNEILQLAV